MKMAPNSIRRWRNWEQDRNTIKIHLLLAVACEEGGAGGTGARVGAYALAFHGKDSRPSPQLRVRQ